MTDETTATPRHEDPLTSREVSSHEAGQESTLTYHEWGVCLTTVDTETGEVLFHADLLLRS